MKQRLRRGGAESVCCTYQLKENADGTATLRIHEYDVPREITFDSFDAALDKYKLILEDPSGSLEETALDLTEHILTKLPREQALQLLDELASALHQSPRMLQLNEPWTLLEYQAESKEAYPHFKYKPKLEKE